MSEEVVSRMARQAVSRRLRDAYMSGSKSEKSGVLDAFCAATGLSRSTARRYLTGKPQPGTGVGSVVKLDRRKHRPTRYCGASKKVLIRLWALMGMPCGKYMARALPQWVASLECHGELVQGEKGWCEKTRREVLAMSPATIDRYLASERQRLAVKGISSTKPGALLRNSIKVRKAGDEVEGEPGFFEADTVAHCGPTLKGEFARTLTLTDVYSGWIELQVLRNNARAHMLAGLNQAISNIPYLIQGLDCDNGSEFINHEVMAWATNLELYFTRSRPYRKNDQACVESKNNHAVRHYGFHYRYDTSQERDILAKLWTLVCLKLNYFTPTKKPIGWDQDTSGKHKRLYDTPTTPCERMIRSGLLSPAQIKELEKTRDSINPAELTRDILRYQNMLIGLAADKTSTLTAQTIQTAQKRAKRLEVNIKTKAS